MEKKPDYEENFIQGNGIQLHYLDWGGSGQPLVLIPGLGDSPYIFLDIASKLSKNFRIIAYSRRGHCKSVANDGRYDIFTLVEDLKLLLDSLNIEKANLLGWSMGGNEITEFAIRYPERIQKLIYFEAGYDLSEEAFKSILSTIPESAFPDNAGFKSPADYKKWYHNFWFSDIEWNPTLEANLLATMLVNPDGSITPIPDDRLSNNILKSVMSYKRNYTSIQAPALAIYAKQWLYPPAKDEKILSIYESMEKDIVVPWRLRNINKMKAELKDLTILEVPNGSHTSFIFLSKDSLVNSINTFLLEK